MAIHYKFKNCVDYDAVKFDGVYISGSDLKAVIAQQKKLTHSELQVMNEETKDVYNDDQLIPKNTNVIVWRVPHANANKRQRTNASHNNNSNSSGNVNGNSHNNHHHNNHHHHKSNNNNNHHHHNHHHSQSGGSSSSQDLSGGALGGGHEALELVAAQKNMSEEEKIKYIQSQSTKDFDPSRYARGGRGGYRSRGGGGSHFQLRPGYTCRKCHIPGHSIYDCRNQLQKLPKRSSGIPRDFLVKADPKDKGALMTPSGEYAVPYIDKDAYSKPKVEKAPFFEEGISEGDETATATTSASTSSNGNKAPAASDSKKSISSS